MESRPENSTSAFTRLPMKRSVSRKNPYATGKTNRMLVTDADHLRDELAAGRRTGGRAPGRRRRSSRSPYVPSAKRPSASAPQAPHTPCTANAPTGSSMRKRISTQDTARTTSRPATRPIRTAAAGLTNAHGRGDRHQAAEQAVAGHRDVGLAQAVPDEDQRREGAGAGGEHGVDGDGGDARIGAGQRRAGVEPEPAERQDQRPDDRHRQVVAGDGADGPVAPELAGARPEHDRAGQRRQSRRSCAPPTSRRNRRDHARAPSSPPSRRASRRPRPSCRRAGRAAST